MANAIAGGTPIPTTKLIPAQNLSPVETHPTLTVKLKNYKGDGDGLAVINAHDFDPYKYEKVNDDGEKDDKVKPKPFEFKETVVEPDLDDNDLKELGGPKTKQEKDRLENVAKKHLSTADQKVGRRRLLEDFEDSVGSDAVQGQQNLPPQMQPTGKIGPGVGDEIKKDDAKKTEDANKAAAKKLDEKLPDKKDEPPLTPRK